MTPPTRILLLCNSYPPEIGAAPLRMQGMAHLLRDAGYEVGVLAGMPNYPTGNIFPQYQNQKAVTETLSGITVRRIPFAPSHSCSRLVRSGSLLSLSSSLLHHGKAFIHSFRPDWLLISSPPLPLAICGAWLARCTGIPFLLNISDLWPLTAKELGALREGLLYKGLQKAESWLLGQARGWVGQSEEILDYIRQRSKVSKPAFLYRNLPQAIIRPATGHLAGAPLRRMVYAGLIGPVQGILSIATQTDFAHHRLELHVYGDGADRKALEAFAARHPEKGVVYKGLLPPEEMFERLPAYDLALASLRTGIQGAVPSKIYTAMAAGLPITFLGAGEGAALIQKHQTGWVLPPGDLTALEAHLAALSQLPEIQLAHMRRQILEVREAHFHPQKQGAAFVRFWELATRQISQLAPLPVIPSFGNDWADLQQAHR